RSQSRASFIAKISIVIEEADESHFWIEFIIDEKLILNQEILELLSEADQLTTIFVSSRKTARKNLS
ncbi:MAG: four helix bundle protein, partial [Candidatus Cloacimonadota bacterium]|nr:four helix bundle protein [Candidatus Cloacimonadota bacterium]